MNKAISFDLWGTLIKGNPIYGAKRLEFLQRFTNCRINIISEIISNIKRKHNILVEQHGVQFSSLDLYKQIIHSLNINKIDAEDLREELGKLFIEYPPILLPDALSILDFCSYHNLDKYLLSNTLMIDGEFIRIALKDILNQFRYKIFSDEVGVSKPNPLIFKIARDTINLMSEKDCDVLHIGDNYITDGAAVKANVNFDVYIKTSCDENETFINNIKQFINK